MLTLPEELHNAITQQLHSVPTARWMREAQAISERYRAERVGGEAALVTGDVQALGYTALIMPATYAQLWGAMAATAQRIPHWQPQSLLDIGSGPGTALWAAVAQWASLERLVAWEREPAFLALGRKLAAGSSAKSLQHAQWHRRDVSTSAAPAGERYDLVVLGHVLNELTLETRRAITQAAWEMTAGVLLIVEPGTAAAFEVVRVARDHLIEQQAHTIAPCPHNRPCPLQNDWCHFPQRLKRPDFQRKARGAPSEWEDSKFSYAAMARFDAQSAIWGRVIREPEWNKAYAEALLSTSDGILRHRALKRHKDQFRVVKDLEWGEALDEPLGPPTND